ncbi:MAG: hypothetical protein LBJ01_08870, partial [Tannerella sp.]|nr:hypothetical protein [Tannerella sp.]
VYLTQASEDFRVKSEIYAVHPLRAKIGVKEGVTVDQRYFVYDIHENAAGEQTTVRKGVMRATSNIAENEGMATGDGPATTFYQTYGKRLRPGMLIRQQPDWGVGCSVLGGMDLQVLVELSVGMWLAKYIPSMEGTKFPYGTKAYLRYGLPFERMQIDGIRMDKNYSYGFISVGLSKDLYFAHYFSITPYVGFQEMLVSEEDQEWIDEVAKPTSGYEAGLNASIAILHNVQLTGSAGWSMLKYGWFPSGLTAGGGLRVQF